MRATVAVIADYANIEQSGKLNILGIFNVINALQIPCTHQQMNLIVRLVADPIETPTAFPVEIQMVDEDGRVILGLKGEMNFPHAPPGELATADQIVGLHNVVFEKFGDYEFKFMVRDECVATIPFVVRQMQNQNPA
ncbi:MAG: hypothetical protein HZC40_24820 [Chloroflexi bacterium]|nr:hypothetical protein [Chloroflexota bacterium]